MMRNAAKNFDILAIERPIIILMIQAKLFSDLYQLKFLDISAKMFFLCEH